MRLAVLQSSGGIPDLAQRCARWATVLGVEVTVMPPAGPRQLVRWLGELGDSGCDGIVLEHSAGDGALAAAVRAAGVPVVAVSVEPLTGASGPVGEACARVIHGRGRSGFRWALAHLRSRIAAPPQQWAYGEGPDRVGDLRLPGDVAPRTAPLAVLLHGGFWRDEWQRDLMDGLAVDLTRRGWITWNVEYRRMGPSGGGWPQTLDDVTAAVAAAPSLPAPVDTGRVVLIGHSAGAQLALCAAAATAETTAPAAKATAARPTLVVGLAPLTDLRAAAHAGVGWGSVTDLLGDPGAHRDRYRDASPVARLPLGVPQRLVHGTADRHVPVSMTRDYAQAAIQAGDTVELHEIADADHFAVIDPAHAAWETVVKALRAVIG